MIHYIAMWRQGVLGDGRGGCSLEGCRRLGVEALSGRSVERSYVLLGFLRAALAGAGFLLTVAAGGSGSGPWAGGRFLRASMQPLLPYLKPWSAR